VGPQFPQNAKMPNDPDRGNLQARGVPDLIRLAVDQEREFGGLRIGPNRPGMPIRSCNTGVPPRFSAPQSWP
jgi:hypothetical protein